MRLPLYLATAVVIALAGCSNFPGKSSKQAEEHSAHHSSDQASKLEAAKIDQQMKAMHDMHQKMQAAKTPAERAALMKDHMKAMQDGMAMMGQMGGMPMRDSGKSSMPGTAHMQKDMMQRRMDMMEMMMQMMMDREAARPPAVR